MLLRMARVVPRFDFRVEWACAEDVGRFRDSFEDAHLIEPELALFAVADGMGGHAAGEVAARLALDAVRDSIAGAKSQRAVEAYIASPDVESRRRVYDRLRRAVERANRAVREAAADEPEHEGMGTTLDVVWLARDHAFVAHAGDGRVYLARSAAVLQLTQDHAQHESLKATGVVRPQRKLRGANRLLNAVGLSDTVQVDTVFVDVAKGSRLLLCSDGIHGQIATEAELGDLLRRGNAEVGARSLVRHASKSGRDNATALVIEVCDRIVRRAGDDRGLRADDLERAGACPLLADMEQAAVLATLAAAVEVELDPGEIVPCAVANDLVAYIVLDGLVRSGERLVGAGAVLFPESLVAVSSDDALPTVEQAARLLRVRADDFDEVCRADAELAAQLYQRLATHLARVSRRRPAR